MLAHAAGTDEFEGFKYVLKADGHWRSAAEVHPRRGRSTEPSSASGECQDLGLFVERKEAGGFDRLNQFPDFGLLAAKAACPPFLLKGFEPVHADGPGERRCTVLERANNSCHSVWF